MVSLVVKIIYMFGIIAFIMNVSLILFITILIIERIKKNYISNFDIIDKFVVELFICDIISVIFIITLIVYFSELLINS